jgi:hypothetical protein
VPLRRSLASRGPGKGPPHGSVLVLGADERVFSFLGLIDVWRWPGWAFKRAHRLSKQLWLAAWIICIILPLGGLGGIFYMLAWGWARKAVKRARDIGDPNAAEEGRQRTDEMQRQRYRLDTLARNQYNAQRPPGSPPAV